MTLLSPQQCLDFADALPDTPQTVITTSQLRRGAARAYALVGTASWETAVIHDPGQPGEPTAFGANPEQIAGLLTAMPDDWFCANVAPEIAPRLGPLLAERMNCPVRHYGDVYHTLTGPAPVFEHPAVRFLAPNDLPLLEAAPPGIRGQEPRRLLAERTAAGGIVNGRLAAIAQNYALSPRYGDIGVATLSDCRRQGLATAAASLVIQWVRENGRIPVWSCGEDNIASLRVAEKLGFREVSRRVYLILDRGNAT